MNHTKQDAISAHVASNHICARCGHQQEDHSGFGAYQPCDHYNIVNGQRENCICYAFVDLRANTLCCTEEAQ